MMQAKVTGSQQSALLGTYLVRLGCLVRLVRLGDLQQQQQQRTG